MGWFFGRDSKEQDDEDVFRHLNRDFFDAHNKKKHEMEEDFSNTFKTWLGAVIGFVLFVFLISLCCACCRRRRRGQILSRGPYPVIQAVPVTQPRSMPVITAVPTQQVPVQLPPPTAPVRPPSLPPTYEQAVGMYERTPAYNPNVPL